MAKNKGATSDFRKKTQMRCLEKVSALKKRSELQILGVLLNKGPRGSPRLPVAFEHSESKKKANICVTASTCLEFIWQKNGRAERGMGNLERQRENKWGAKKENRNSQHVP